MGCDEALRASKERRPFHVAPETSLFRFGVVLLFFFFFWSPVFCFVFFLLNGCCCGSCGDAPTPRCGPSELTADTVDGDAGRRSKSTPTPTPPTPTQHMRSERRQPALVCFFSFRSTVCVCVCALDVYNGVATPLLTS